MKNNETSVRCKHDYCMQQPCWNTVDLAAFENKKLLFDMIGEAYNAVLQKMTRKDRSRLNDLSQLVFHSTDGQDADFQMLCGRLDDTLDAIVAGTFERKQYAVYNRADLIQNAIIVYWQGVPIACGGLKPFDEEHAELKRIYVEPAYQNMGIGAEILRRLEAEAKMKGFHWCILETGELLEAACHVYRKAGYQVIPNYGPYADMPDSVCMSRKI